MSEPIVPLDLALVLAHYKEEVNRLRAHERTLKAEIDEARSIVLDLVGMGERLANQLESQQAMEDKYNGWWYPSLATARVWLGKNKKNETP